MPFKKNSYVVPPVAVKVTDSPAQIVFNVAFEPRPGVGNAFTVTFATVDVVVQFVVPSEATTL